MPEADAPTTRCPACGRENPLSARKCEAASCTYPLGTELEALRSIDRNSSTIRRIAIWFLILSILSVVFSLLALLGAFR